MYTLHYYPGNASFAPHVALEQAGAVHELMRVDREHDAHKQADYLALNPNGRIPVLLDGKLVLYEAAAICLHIADKHPDSQLMPPLGSDTRAHAYKWLMWLTNTLQSEMLVFHYPHRHVTDEARTSDVKQRAAERLVDMFELLDTSLADRVTLVEGVETIADPYLLMIARWGRGLHKPPAEFPALRVALDATVSRGPVQRTFESEGMTPGYGA